MISPAAERYNETHSDVDWVFAIVQMVGPAPVREFPLDQMPVATKRDNYGLVGSKGKKAKNKKANRAKWEAFQRSVQP